MTFGEWMNSKVQKIHWTDISLIKLSTAGFVLFVAKLWAPLLSLAWQWYLLIGIMAAMKPAYKMFAK